MFEFVYFCRQTLCCVVFVDNAPCLEQGDATVIFVVYYVYGDAALFLMVVNDRLMHMVAIHSFASVFGKQCGVYVDNLVWK